MQGFTFLCCVLFFLFQVCSLFLSWQQTDSSAYQLQAVSPDSLALVKQTHKKASNEDAEVVSSGLASSAPFFFKPVPVNYCDEELLLSITGIGPGLASNILKTRKRIGFFEDKHDLLQVPGIGEARMNRFSTDLSFEIHH